MTSLKNHVFENIIENWALEQIFSILSKNRKFCHGLTVAYGSIEHLYNGYHFYIGASAHDLDTYCIFGILF